MMVLRPFKNIPESRRKKFGPMSFEGKIMGGNKIKNVPIILEAKLRLMSQFSIKVYIGNAPPNHCLMMMGHRQNTFFLAAPEREPELSTLLLLLAFLEHPSYVVNKTRLLTSLMWKKGITPADTFLLRGILRYGNKLMVL
jgi:hypothetical protein